MTVASRTIYLNTHGAELSVGRTNSQTQTSSLISKAASISGWDAPPEDWASVVACTKAMWAPFDVTITDVDPGITPHIEVLIGGSPKDIGLSGNWGGISPFRSDCSAIEDSIVFVFTDNQINDPTYICNAIGMEVGHSYGLDHVILEADVMSYWYTNVKKTFTDVTTACGEGEAVQRVCGGTCRPAQNSYEILLERLGSSEIVPTLHEEVPILLEEPPEASESVDPAELGCSAGGNPTLGILIAFAALLLLLQRRR